MGKPQAQHVHCVLEPACASRRLFEAISGKWSPLVVMALKDGEKKRPGELRRG
jgi:DNA-binding HxlR family transcriptional regulator